MWVPQFTKAMIKPPSINKLAFYKFRCIIKKMKKLLLSLPLLLIACVTPDQQIAAVKNRASYDLSCDSQKLKVTWLQAGTYGAEGCKGKQVYQVQGTMVYKEGAAPNPVYVEEPAIYGDIDYVRYRR